MKHYQRCQPLDHEVNKTYINYTKLSVCFFVSTLEYSSRGVLWSVDMSRVLESTKKLSYTRKYELLSLCFDDSSHSPRHDLESSIHGNELLTVIFTWNDTSDGLSNKVRVAYCAAINKMLKLFQVPGSITDRVHIFNFFL